jgi:dipeptidyl aminopeptidase/acylaminoacyl peptidase
VAARHRRIPDGVLTVRITSRSSRGLLLAALACSLASTAIAQDVFTPWNLAKVRGVSAVTPSPDGARVAYLLAVPRDPMTEADGGAWQELHVVEVATGRDTTFVGRDAIGSPQWTPDGTGLSFLAKRGTDATRGVHLIPLGGGEARRVLAHDSDILGYEWSRDGRQIAFLATPPAPKGVEDLRKKGFSQEIFEEGLRSTQVFVAAADGSAKPRALDLPGSASLVRWSPDGRKLAIVLAPTPLVDDDLMRRRVHVVDAASGQVESNLDNPGKLGSVAWSPDSRHLAIVTAEDINDPAAGRLWVRAATGGTWKDVLPNYLGHVADIDWTGADTIAFIGGEGVETVLGEVRADGSGRKTRVAAGGQILRSVTAASGLLAFAADSPRHPAEVFVLTATASAPKRLTNSNPWLETIRFAPQEVVTFKARDGQELQGILIKPLVAPAGGRAPLILTVHGGPEAHDSNGWLTGYASPGQVAAARGFAVFYPNYRGSTGRGVAFSKLSQGDPAGKEFDDLVDAVDHLVATGVADKAKVGITGGSYGGYATGWASTYYSDRFAAGVMFVGISDKISKVGTTDIANEEFLVHARKRPWDAWQFMLERSPIYHAGKSKTPLLILHGKDDPRVHPTQSLELYRYLKLHGKAPVRLVWYPGEQHGNRRAASRLDFNLRMLQWFEHYLQGAGGQPPAGDIDYQEPKAAAPTTAAVRP